ncbi:hypothetical protein ES708_31914 [subsurface metagenome]
MYLKERGKKEKDNELVLKKILKKVEKLNSEEKG